MRHSVQEDRQLREPDATLILLAETAADFARVDVERTRRLRDDGGDVDRAMWARLGENGWLSIMVPEIVGGAGLGAAAATIVARRLGYAAFPEPFVAAGILAPSVLAAATTTETQGRLDAVVSGDTLVGVAWQAPLGGLDRADGVTRTSQRLQGESRFVGLDGADAYVVATRSADGLSLYWVPQDTAGLTITHERTADGTSWARLRLDDVAEADVECILPPGDAEAALFAGVEAARVVVSAELVGIADRALELTLDYLRQRRQFDRPIGAFQALQHRAVDMWMSRQLAEASVDTAADVFDSATANATARSTAASAAKARASATALAICSEAIQLHGAIGFTDEYDLGVYANRALVLSAWLGNAAAHRHRYSTLALLGAQP